MCRERILKRVKGQKQNLISPFSTLFLNILNMCTVITVLNRCQNVLRSEYCRIVVCGKVKVWNMDSLIVVHRNSLVDNTLTINQVQIPARPYISSVD